VEQEKVCFFPDPEDDEPDLFVVERLEVKGERLLDFDWEIMEVIDDDALLEPHRPEECANRLSFLEVQLDMFILDRPGLAEFARHFGLGSPAAEERDHRAETESRFRTSLCVGFRGFGGFEFDSGLPQDFLVYIDACRLGATPVTDAVFIGQVFPAKRTLALLGGAVNDNVVVALEGLLELAVHFGALGVTQHLRRGNPEHLIQRRHGL
jgi:hypothetical protein